MRCAAGWSTCSRAARSRRCGSTSSATRSRASALRPADQRTIGRVDGFTLLPASEALLDEESVKRFRSRYRERFGATATGDPLYQAVSDGRRLAGMEHWLPLFEEKLATLFDHLGADDVMVRDAGDAGRGRGPASRRSPTITRTACAREACEPGSYRPLPANALYLAPRANGAEAAGHAHLVTPIHEPTSATVLDFGVDGPRDFAPERAAQENVYEAVVAHVAQAAQGRAQARSSPAIRSARASG